MEPTAQLPGRTPASMIGDGNGRGSSPPPMAHPAEEIREEPTEARQEPFGLEPVRWEFSGMNPESDPGTDRDLVDYGTGLRCSVPLPIAPWNMSLPHVMPGADPLKAILTHAARSTEAPVDGDAMPPTVPEAIPSLYAHVWQLAQEPMARPEKDAGRWVRRRESSTHPSVCQRVMVRNHFQQCTARKPLTEL